MATTTNYGWTTPNDTDLVKDGAAAIRTLGSSVDTTTKALNPSTTLGDIEYRSATANTNTRLAIGTTGQVLTVAGGVPTWATSDDANAIQNAIVDAKGDLIAASAADTPARLAVGANGTVLTADSAEATGLKWAAAAGGGKVLQVVSATYSTAKTIATTTYTDTDLTASITPSSASSKILILVSQMWYFNRTGVVVYPKGQIVRNSTSIFEHTFLGGFGVPNATGTIEAFNVWSPSYLDSPSTTSSTTYKTQMARQTLTSGDLIVSFGNVAASIILLEIGA